MLNRLNKIMPEFDEKRYTSVMKLIEDLLRDGTVDEAIIANAAKMMLKRVKLLQDYQVSPEWDVSGWGDCLVELDGVMYFIGKLRHEKEDFEVCPFVGYEVVGKTKLKLKRKSDVTCDYYSDVRITWQGVKKMKKMMKVHLKMPCQTINDALSQYIS